MAKKAKKRLEEILAGNEIDLRNISYDNFGRVLADVHLPNGKSVGDLLLDEGLASVYERGNNGNRWCR